MRNDEASRLTKLLSSYSTTDTLLYYAPYIHDRTGEVAIAAFMCFFGGPLTIVADTEQFHALFTTTKFISSLQIENYSSIENVTRDLGMLYKSLDYYADASRDVFSNLVSAFLVEMLHRQSL